MQQDNLLKKAIFKQKIKQTSEARNIYLKILQKNPNHLDANYLLGTLFAENNELDKAERYLLKAVAIAPKSPMIQTNLGNVYKLQGKLAQAEQCFQSAIQGKPDLAPAYLGLGLVWELARKETKEKILECYQKAISYDPSMAEAFQRIAGILAFVGREVALEYYEKAARLNPNLKGLMREYGVALVKFGRYQEAAERLRMALKKNQNDVQSEYFLCIAEGRQPEVGLQQRYVAKEFDGFSTTFDTQLVGKLQYAGPALLRGLIAETCGSDVSYDNVADLGCGTGLSGLEFRALANNLVGIDLSEAMLKQAEARKCYDQLFKGDICEVLAGLDVQFDLFVAADVVMYMGALEALFAAIMTRAGEKASFAFFTEHWGGAEPFVLQQTGRFAHRPDYIHRVVEKAGGRLFKEKPCDIRKELEQWVKGDLYFVQLRP